MIRDRLAPLRLWVGSLPPAVRAALFWDTVSGVLAGVYIGCIWTFVPRVARADLSATETHMGWITAAPAIGYMFATLWARKMEGRAKMPFIYYTWLVSRGLFMLAPFVASRTPYFAMVCLTPIIFSISTPAYTSIMKEIYPDAVRGRLMSVVRIAASLATFLTALVVGRWMDAGLDWRWSFCAGGGFGALTALTFSRIPVTANPDEQDRGMSTTQFLADTLDILRRNSGFRWFSASVFVYGFGNIMAFTLYPIHQVDAFHVRNTDLANMQNIATVLQILGFVLWGSILDRRGPLTCVFVAICLICAMPPFYALATSLTPIYIAAAIGGLAFSGIELGYLNSILQLAEPGRAAQYQALHSSLFGIRGSIAPFCAIPLMAVVGIRAAFWACLGVMLCGVALQLVSMREHRRDSARQRPEPPSDSRVTALPYAEKPVSEVQD